jgi:hypothetical protein
MLSEAKHPYWIDLTLSAGADIPLLVKERDKRVRFAILNLSCLSLQKGEGRQGEVAIPAKERDQRVRFAILTLSSLCDR